MEKVTFKSTNDIQLRVKYGKTNPKKLTKFTNGILITGDEEKIEAIRNIIKRGGVPGVSEVKYTKKPEPKKPEPKKQPQRNQSTPKKEEPKKEDNKIKLR